MIWKFVKKVVFASLFFWALIGVYVLVDPYKVVFDYDDYFEDQTVELNLDYISIETFDKYRDSLQYNAFICGSSRSLVYYIDAWKQHLAECAGEDSLEVSQDIRALHVASYGETLFGLCHKLQYLGKHTRIEHLLLILDNEMLGMSQDQETTTCFVSPKAVGYRNLLDFHWKYFKSFYYPGFLVSYLGYRYLNIYRSFMSNYIVTKEAKSHYDKYLNERYIYSDYHEKKMADETYYTPEILALFAPDADAEPLPEPVIDAKGKQMLTALAQLLHDQQTEYEIVISPMWNKCKVDEADLAFLKEIFGASKIHDYSGVNDITTDYHNYYENSHYRVPIANRIMNEVYHL